MSPIVTRTGFPADSATYPSLAGRRVFITGGGSGIGASLVEGFCRQGATVAFVDVDAGASAALLDSLRARGLPAPWFRYCDVRDVRELQRAIGDAAAVHGDMQVLVNNVANDDRRATAEITPEYWDERMSLNQRPAFFAIQAVLPGMSRVRCGSIINIGSVGWVAKTSGYPAYAAAKASVLGLTRGLARELGTLGIRINVVSPGWVMTERQVKLWSTPDMEEVIARIQCLPQPLHPPDIAAMVLFLASDDARGCTAQEFIVDGGWS